MRDSIGLEEIKEIEIGGTRTYQANITIGKKKHTFRNPDIMICLAYLLRKEEDCLHKISDDVAVKGGYMIGSLDAQGYSSIILSRYCHALTIVSSKPEDITEVLTALAKRKANHLWGKCRALLAKDALRMMI